ncbi:MAG: Na+/H+ antiporter NhaA [Bacteroidetes bacterium]|nr:Na+/H+ antiporter NhaA [Bacteroidota bacterium]
MKKFEIQKEPVDRWIVDPMKRFISNSTTSGILLFSSALLAMLLANSPWSNQFHHLWEIEFSIGFNGSFITKSLHHWINDGLMAVFFFVVGLELKREIVAGELRDVRKAMLPIGAAIGGMIFPAAIYFMINPSGEASEGWGIPMATDIAFALGVLYLLGDKVPLSLKIFLTALAITDDLGAVLVIAFCYTSSIDFVSLFTGGVFLLVLIISNLLGVRNTLYYAVVGIGGLWLAFLMSGVHATIAAVLAAFTIPIKVKVSEIQFGERLDYLLSKFKAEKPNNLPTVTNEQLHILQEIRDVSKYALTPLQRLEHALHPLVSFVIMPVFALANAGITLSNDILSQFLSPVSLGVFFGLIAGKVVGVLLMVTLFLKLKWAVLPAGINKMHLIGVSFLAAIGFTMSLFIVGLAFTNEAYILQAKLGILVASLTASIIGFFIIKKASAKTHE